MIDGCYTNGGAYHHSRLQRFMQTLTPEEMKIFMMIVAFRC